MTDVMVNLTDVMAAVNVQVHEVLDLYEREIEKAEAHVEAEAARDMHSLSPNPMATAAQEKIGRKQRKKVARWHKLQRRYLAGKRAALRDLRASFTKMESPTTGD